jgi:hypothetical protein
VGSWREEGKRHVSVLSTAIDAFTRVGHPLPYYSTVCVLGITLAKRKLEGPSKGEPPVLDLKLKRTGNLI